MGEPPRIEYVTNPDGSTTVVGYPATGDPKEETPASSTPPSGGLVIGWPDEPEAPIWA